MTHTVGAKGQVVIPKTFRDALGLDPGDEVDFELERNAVRVRPLRSRGSLKGLLAGESLVAMLEADRRAERR